MQWKQLAVIQRACETIRQRLLKFAIPHDRLDEDVVRETFFSKGPDIDDNLLSLIEDLMEDHTSVSTEDMQLALSWSDISDSDDMETGPAIYVRTWEIPRGVLRRILAAVAVEDIMASGEDVDIENDTMDPATGTIVSTLPSAWAWADRVLADNTDNDLGDTFDDHEKVYARYVGQSRIDPRLRQFQDENYQYGYLKRFLEHLERETADDEQVGQRLHYFVPPNGDQQEELDFYERMAIAFFDHGKLLNRQPGGELMSYDPTWDLDGGIGRISTVANDVLMQLPDASQPVDHGVQVLFQEWATSVQQYGNQNRLAIQAGRHPFTDGRRDAILRESVARMFFGHVPVVLLGYEITLTDYISESTFWAGGSKSSIVVREMFKALGMPETDWPTRVESRLPFVDVLPWLSHSLMMTDAPRLQLLQYLSIARPLIMVSLGAIPSSLAMANFAHMNGIDLARSKFLDYVGIPTLQHYAGEEYLDNGDDMEPPENDLTLVIPHYDPGYDKHTIQTVEYRDLMLATWNLTFAVLACLLRFLQHDEQAQDMTHGEIVKYLYHRCQPDHEEFSAHFVALELQKQRLDRVHTQEVAQRLRPVRPVDSDSSGLRSLAASRFMAEDRVTVGAPNSQERRHQAIALYKRNRKRHYLHIARENKKDWIEWVVALPEGINIGARAMNELQVRQREERGEDPLQHLLGSVAPKNAEPGWHQDPVKRQAALDRVGVRLRSTLTAAQRSANATGANLQRWAAQGRVQLQGRVYPIRKDGSIYTRRMIGNVSTPCHLSAMWVTRHYPGVLRNQVRLQFVEEGLLLVDARTRQECRHPDGRVTFPRPFGVSIAMRTLERIWVLERQTMNQPILDLPEQQLVNAGEPIPPQRATAFIKTLIAGPVRLPRPIRDRDALFLLKEWLNHSIGRDQEGTLYLINEAEAGVPGCPDAVNINGFPQYIQTVHPDHPYAQSWIQCIRAIGVEGARTGQVKNGLAILRTGFQAKKRTIKRRDAAGNVIGTASVHDIQIGPQRDGVEEDDVGPN